MLDALDFHAEGAVKCARVGKGKICLSDDINALMDEANVGAEKMYQAGLQCIRRNSTIVEDMYLKKFGRDPLYDKDHARAF